MITLDAFGNPVVGGPDFGTCVTVENTAALRLFTVEPQPDDMVITLGDAAQGDGNGAFWYWVPNSTLPDDGVNVVKCDDIFAGRFYRNGLSGTGINELTGDVTAGPGGGLQLASIASGAVDTAKLANGAVTATKLDSLAVETAKIAASAVTTAKIADANVTAAKLATDSVETAKIAASAVTTAKIADGNVTLAKMANLAADTVIGSSLGGAPTALTMTLAGRSLVASGTPTSQLALLGGLSAQSIDLAGRAAQRACALLSLTYPTMVINEPFVASPGVRPNFFDGTSTNVTTLDGGWKKISTTSTPGNTTQWTHASPSTTQITSNVGTKKWYQLWLVKLDATIDSTARVKFGLVDTALSSDGPSCGAHGSASTTKFRFFDGVTGVNSSVNLDAGVHIIELWCTGSGSVSGSVDGETAVTYTTAKTTACTPHVEVTAGSGGAQSASVGHCIMITGQS